MMSHKYICFKIISMFCSNKQVDNLYEIFSQITTEFAKMNEEIEKKIIVGTQKNVFRLGLFQSIIKFICKKATNRMTAYLCC